VLISNSAGSRGSATASTSTNSRPERVKRTASLDWSRNSETCGQVYSARLRVHSKSNSPRRCADDGTRGAPEDAMIAKRYKAVMELYNEIDGERREGFEQVLERNGMTVDELMGAIDEVLSSGNDVEGAAIEIAALNLAYPDHDADEYFEARSVVLKQRCLLWKLYSEPDFPSESELEFKVEEMLDIIGDGEERIAAGFPLAI
jgi:hypothetical protein